MMDRVEAKWLLLRRMVAFRRRPYKELRSMFGNHTESSIRGRLGAEYCVEVEVFWDDQPNGDIRISGAIDDGGRSAFCPLTWGDLVSPPQ
jgi:hypothetical protein